MEVATITGYKDLRMLQRYTHLRAEDLAKKLSLDSLLFQNNKLLFFKFIYSKDHNYEIY